MTMSENDQDSSAAPGPGEAPEHHPEQEHPIQDAHGGSMAPGLADDTGHPVAEAPPAAPDE
jgi:hypothetical protein